MKIEIVSDVVCPWCYIGEAAGRTRRRDPRSGYAVKSRRSLRSTP
jgi:predicted DsbA family dithiol-disulfide isomerase